MENIDEVACTGEVISPFNTTPLGLFTANASSALGFGWTPPSSMILTEGIASGPQSTSPFSFGMTFHGF